MMPIRLTVGLKEAFIFPVCSSVCLVCIVMLSEIMNKYDHDSRNQAVQRLGFDDRTKNESHLNDVIRNLPPDFTAAQFLDYRHQFATSHNLTITNFISNPKCLQIAKDPNSFWKSELKGNSSFTADDDHARMNLAVDCGAMWIPEFLKTPPKAELYDFEREYLSDPPLTDAKRASSNIFSKVTLVNTSSTFVVGDTVALRVDMSDGYGQPKVKGGDEVRAWLKDRSSSVACHVTDHKNGTYLVTCLLPWEGQLRVFVELTYPREFFTVLFTSHLVLKTLAPIVAGFENSLASEATLCFNAPVLPGYGPSEICNVTSVNGSPWYCGRPVKPKLSCGDYNRTRLISSELDAPLLSSEIQVLHRKIIGFIGTDQKLLVRVLPRTGLIGSVKPDTRMIPSVPCSTVPPRMTWEQREPTGYFFRGAWQSLMCQVKEDYDAGCRKNVQILMLGDSNLRGHYYTEVSRMKCDQILKASTEKWHKPLLCVNQSDNFTMKWFPHSNPFRSSRNVWAHPLKDMLPANIAIDDIPSTGRHIILFNHYLHLTGQHISVYEEKMVVIRDALIRVFARNPNVIAALQAPHIVRKGYGYRMGDMLSRMYVKIQMEVFKDLRDKLVYFPLLDLTTACQNEETHPTQGVSKYLTKYLLGTVCDRVPV
ncbi:unnamed protein product [Lymnaea stagnalis]|uniref:NXPE C-terminal domain-containing protein n=1 Tax=Lymnaea stagnalis TaxID=6523 RepID=A0AAV2HI28_LYMST